MIQPLELLPVEVSEVRKRIGTLRISSSGGFLLGESIDHGQEMT